MILEAANCLESNNFLSYLHIDSRNTCNETFKVNAIVYLIIQTIKDILLIKVVYFRKLCHKRLIFHHSNFL